MKSNSSTRQYLNNREGRGVLAFFHSLNSTKDIQGLIKEGETENQYLECKSPAVSYLNKGMKNKLSKYLSAFVNSGGGIIIWGVRTNEYRGLDRLTQIEHVPLVKSFKKDLDLNIPILTIPPVRFLNKLIKEKTQDKKGLVISYIFPTKGDPVRAEDGNFYLRIKDKTQQMPYEVIKRMFLGADTPELFMILDPQLIKVDTQGRWKIPITLSNNSSYAAKNTQVGVTINNPDACEKIDFTGFKDASDLNPGSRIYITWTLSAPIYKKLDSVIGEMMVTLRARRRLFDITVTIYSEKMRARYQIFKIYLFRKKFKIKETKRDYLY
ncbi:hypothetical protein ES703_12944 [subsurface metagenome]